MAKRTGARIHLVLVKNEYAPVYVDTAWSSAEGAEHRIADLAASAKAFDCTKKLDLRTLEMRLDILGVPIVIDVYRGDKPAVEITDGVTTIKEGKEHLNG